MKKILILALCLLFTIKTSSAELSNLQEDPAKGTYINNVYSIDGLITRWNTNLFPIRVFIEKDQVIKVPEYYQKAFINGANLWQTGSNGLIRLKFVPYKTEADIIIKVIRNPATNQEKLYSIAYTYPVRKQDKLDKMYIQITDKDPGGNYHLEEKVMATTAHEFGHALGILGHSTNPNDIMYPKNNRNSLSEADKKTLMLLYQLKADITNGNNTNPEKNTLAGNLAVGTKIDRINQSIELLKKEAQIKKTSPEARIKLAYLYDNKRDYVNMLKYIEEANALSTNKNDKKDVDFAYAVYYFRMKNKKQAQYHIYRVRDVEDSENARLWQKYIESL